MALNDSQTALLNRRSMNDRCFVKHKAELLLLNLSHFTFTVGKFKFAWASPPKQKNVRAFRSRKLFHLEMSWQQAPFHLKMRFEQFGIYYVCLRNEWKGFKGKYDDSLWCDDLFRVALKSIRLLLNSLLKAGIIISVIIVFVSKRSRSHTTHSCLL